MKYIEPLKTLYTKEKAFSLRGRLYFFDEKGNKKYEAIGEFNPFLGHRIFKNKSLIAYIRKEKLITRKFYVETYLEHFEIYAYDDFPSSHEYEVLSGKYKGALFSGGLFFPWI